MSWHRTKCLPRYRKKVKRRHCRTGFAFAPPGETKYRFNCSSMSGPHMNAVARLRWTFNFARLVSTRARVYHVLLFPSPAELQLSKRTKITEIDRYLRCNVHPIDLEYNISTSTTYRRFVYRSTVTIKNCDFTNLKKFTRHFEWSHFHWVCIFVLCTDRFL